MRFEDRDHSYLSGQGYRMTGGKSSVPSRGPGPAILGVMLVATIAVGIVAYLSVRG